MNAPLRLGVLAATLLLAGCATTAIDDNFAAVDRYGREHAGSEARWLRSAEERAEMAREVDRLLGAPLAADDAVRIALGYSPAFQVVLAEAASTSAEATASARLGNPVFRFEHLVRAGGGERVVEIGRALGFSLLDVLLLPARRERAELAQQQTRLRASAALLDTVTRVRQAWVNAVAAGQTARYYGEVREAAEASAELARRMQAAGNFSRLQRARQQAFYAEAVAGQARAAHNARAAREALVRLLGLSAEEAARLSLPERLPELPTAPRDEAGIARTALDERLDVRLSRAELEWRAKDLGITRVTSVVNDIDAAVLRNHETGEPRQRGYELEVPLPLFDPGDAARAGAQARYLAAANRHAQTATAASSQVRETYGAYRTAFDLARHYRDEVVPLRKSIADEAVLQYNGMLIGVFELLAETRAQIAAVIQAIEAERDFWAADAALQATLLGAPDAAAPDLQSASAAAAPAAGGGH